MYSIRLNTQKQHLICLRRSKMKKLFTLMLLITGPSTMALALECKTANNRLPHQIQLVVLGNKVQFAEKWNGPYKTNSQFTGLIVSNTPSINWQTMSLSFKAEQSDISDKPYTQVTLHIDSEKKSGLIVFKGLLAPNTTDFQILKCSTSAQ